MECYDCEHKFEKYEQYVEMSDGTNLCEQCFWERAIKYMVAKERKKGFEKED